MPQMAPMNWLILFFSFVMIFVTCINKIFYISINDFTSVHKNESTSSMKLNAWKW